MDNELRELLRSLSAERLPSLPFALGAVQSNWSFFFFIHRWRGEMAQLVSEAMRWTSLEGWWGKGEGWWGKGGGGSGARKHWLRVVFPLKYYNGVCWLVVCQSKSKITRDITNSFSLRLAYTRLLACPRGETNKR